MSDDLSAFFAKKKDKKKKTAVKMDDVGQILERKAKRQEEHDLESNDVDKFTRQNDSKQSANNGEESEWIEYEDSNQGRLEGLKIKDMGAESEIIEEEPHESEEPKEQQGSARTWGQLEKKDEGDVESATEMAAYQQSRARPTGGKFVPSALRGGGGERYHRAAAVDVSNQEMFPSLADASKIEKDKKDEVKTGGGWVKTGSSENRPTAVAGRGWGGPAGPPSSISAGRERNDALAAVKALAQSSPAPSRPIEPVVEKAAPAAPEKPAYVPPHLRNRN